MGTTIDLKILKQFPESFQDHLSEVFNLSNEIFDGTHPYEIEIRNIQYSYPKIKIEEGTASRFGIALPYANTQIEFYIHLDIHNLDLAPDFTFNDEFLEDPSLCEIEENIPSWNNWNIENVACFKNIIKEFYFYYKKYQISLLEKQSESRALTEHACLGNVDTRNLEVLVEGDNITFFIHLDLEFPQFQPDKKKLGKSEASLLVRYNKSNIAETKLYPSQQLRQILNEKQLKLPSFTDDSLTDYVTTITAWLNNKLKSIWSNDKKSQEFISTLILMYPNGVIEYDAVNFRKAELLFVDDDNFTWMMAIQLGKTFPNAQPKVIMHSVNSMENETLSNYPYSSKWKPEMMIKEIINKALEKIEAFKMEVLSNKSD